MFVPTLSANIVPVIPLKIDGYGYTNLLSQKPQSSVGSMHQYVILKSKIQPFNSHFQFQEQPKEYLARIMETATEQVEHKVDHGKVKTEEDIDIIAICQF